MEMTDELREKFEKILNDHEASIIIKLTGCRPFVFDLMHSAYQLDRSEWVSDIDLIVAGTNTTTIIVLFDTGEMCFYSDKDWPRAIVVGWFEIPQPPNQK